MASGKCKEIEIKTRFFRYAAKKWGDSSGLPVLGLHGWLDNAATFDFLAPLLPDLQLIALDFPGHGFSAHRPLGMKYHYADYIDDVINVTDALGWKTFSLIGHSMGAGVATLTAGAFPDRIQKLVLIEGIGPMTGETGDSPLHLSKSINQMRIIKKKSPPIYKDLKAIIDARLKVGDMKEDSVEVLVKRGVIELERGVTWRSDPRLKVTSPVYFTDDQVNLFLDKITASSLLITGKTGYLAQRSYTSPRCARVKNIKHVVLPGGHHLHLDDPKPVAEIIRPFIF